jgi:glutamate formiminotransferase/formiminotetrahydrofolate cyclodeaminase
VKGNPITGKIKKDEQGNEIWIPGMLKACKAIGWYIEEYGIAQVSINLTNISITPCMRRSKLPARVPRKEGCG